MYKETGCEYPYEVNYKLMRFLPDCLKPKILSKVVREKLVTDKEMVELPNNSFCNDFIKRLSDVTFLEALERIFKYGCNKNTASSTHPQNNDFKLILNRLEQLSIQCVSKINTVLYFEQTVIPESERERIFHCQQNENGLVIYIYINKDVSKLFALLWKSIAEYLDLTHAMILSDILRLPIEEIGSLLDDHKIPGTEQFCLVSKRLLIIPGELVRIEHHSLLDKNFGLFYDGKCVVVERSNGEENIYIYGKILERSATMEDGIALCGYKVQIGLDKADVIKVKGYDIYKFCKDSYHGGSENLAVVSHTSPDDNVKQEGQQNNVQHCDELSDQSLT